MVGDKRKREISMRSTKKYIMILLLGLTLIIAGCGKDVAVEAEVPEPTETVEQTEVPEVTEAPKETAVPEVTATPEPTGTLEPTGTPEPTQEPQMTEKPKQEARLIQGFCKNLNEEGFATEPTGSFWLKLENGMAEIVRSDGDMSEYLLEEIKKLDIPEELPAWGGEYFIQEQDKSYRVVLTVDIEEDMLPSFEIPEGWEYEFGAPRIGTFMGYKEEDAGASPMSDGNYFGYEDRLAQGCSTYCACWNLYKRCSASSCLQPEKYGVEKMFDENRRDAWVEGVPGPGIGETFQETTLEHGGWIPVFNYTEMCIVNGYAKNETVWQENNRVKSMKLYFENEYMGLITLEDTMQPQYIDLSAVKMQVGNGCEVTFRFEIVEVYPGTKYDDTCISGLIMEFEGRSH